MAQLREKDWINCRERAHSQGIAIEYYMKFVVVRIMSRKLVSTGSKKDSMSHALSMSHLLYMFYKCSHTERRLSFGQDVKDGCSKVRKKEHLVEKSVDHSTSDAIDNKNDDSRRNDGVSNHTHVFKLVDYASATHHIAYCLNSIQTFLGKKSLIRYVNTALSKINVKFVSLRKKYQTLRCTTIMVACTNEVEMAIRDLQGLCAGNNAPASVDGIE